jgi:putative Holliday junction resolvase
VTDSAQIIAGPLTVIHPDKIYDFISEYLKNEPVERFVVGLPLNLDGAATNSTIGAENFARSLRNKFKLPVDMVDERYSSLLAQEALIAAGARKKDRAKKENIDNLNYILSSLLNQCDFLYINMINHNLLSKSSKKYSFLNNDKIILTSFKEDNFESYFSQYENHGKDSYYFLLDDNTKYPYNYSKVMIENMVKYDNEFILCNSGFNLNNQFYDMDNKTEGFEVSSPNIMNSCFYVGNFELNTKSLKEINLYNQYDYFQNNKGVKFMMLDKIRLWLKFYKK